MSLAPPTDIVLEVSRAADPARAAAVTQKLNAIASQGAGSPSDFAAALNATAPTPPAVSAPAMAAPATREAKAQRQLESVFLSQFIGEMLPKDAPSAFGQGYAGDMWRSMLAERVADQIAASGRLGIASRLFANKPMAASTQLLAPEKGRGLEHAAVTETSANALSAPSSAEVDNGAVLFARKAPA